MNASINTLSRLQQWFRTTCDGDWEHGHGIIATLDNPGWSLKVDLEASGLADRECAPVRVDWSENDWLRYRVDGDTFVAYGGPENLDEMISAFLNWASDLPIKVEG
jgi:immunity protein 53 of polymorphic toxin system